MLAPPIPAPFSSRHRIGLAHNYFIHERYEIREQNEEFDDTPFTDEFQLPVYLYAKKIATEFSMSRILDVGCGSGFKLVTLFPESEGFFTTGLETERMTAWLKMKYPANDWSVADWTNERKLSPQMVICADVIEHVIDPNRLLNLLYLYRPQRIILSTPERDELCLGTHDGPPRNPHHVREWNFAELHAYLLRHFLIREHFVYQGTQVAELALLPR